MTEQRRRDADTEETLHAEAERLRLAMLSLVGDLLDVSADLRALLPEIQGSDDTDG